MISKLTRCLIVAACFWSVSGSAQSDPVDPTAPPEPTGECAVDSDCPANFICQTEETGTCNDCAEGECESECITTGYSYCRPPPPTPCSADADCAGADVCVSYTYEACSGPVDIACSSDPGDGPCDLECAVQTEAYCVPSYVAPCQADADCGAGFTCESNESCSCASSGSTGEGTDTYQTPNVEPSCSCEPTDGKYCRVIIVECGSDADCAQDLECVSGGNETTVDFDGTDSSGGASPEPSERVSYCLPPGFSYWGGTNGGDEVAQESGANGTLSGTDRISWGTSSNGSGSKANADGCSTIEGDAALSLLGLFGLVGFFRRRG